MTENQAMRIPGTLSTSPGDDWGTILGREKPDPPVLTASHGVPFLGKVTQKRGSMPV